MYRPLNFFIYSILFYVFYLSGMDINTDVRFKAGGQQQSIHTDINPWAFMFCVGYRF